VSDSGLMPNEQFFSDIMVRTNYKIRWWWCSLFTRPTPLVGLL